MAYWILYLTPKEAFVWCKSQCHQGRAYTDYYNVMYVQHSCFPLTCFLQLDRKAIAKTSFINYLRRWTTHVLPLRDNNWAVPCKNWSCWLRYKRLQTRWVSRKCASLWECTRAHVLPPADRKSTRVCTVTYIYQRCWCCTNSQGMTAGILKRMGQWHMGWWIWVRFLNLSLFDH